MKNLTTIYDLPRENFITLDELGKRIGQPKIQDAVANIGITLFLEPENRISVNDRTPVDTNKMAALGGEINPFVFSCICCRLNGSGFKVSKLAAGTIPLFMEAVNPGVLVLMGWSIKEYCKKLKLQDENFDGLFTFNHLFKMMQGSEGGVFDDRLAITEKAMADLWDAQKIPFEERQGFGDNLLDSEEAWK